MKPLLVMTVLLFVMQAPLPIPGKAADAHALAGQNIEDQGKNKKQNATPSPLTVETNLNRPRDADGSQNGQNTEHTVVIRELPPVTVTPGWGDRAYIVFTGLLVVVAILQWLALSGQNRIARVIERPWLVSEMENLPTEYVPSTALRLACHIRNTGKTPAFLIEKNEAADFLAPGESLPDIPQAYGNAVKWEGQGFAFPPGALIVPMFYVTSGEAKMVYQGDRILWFRGFVRYRDGFGDTHETRYCYRYTPRIGGKDPTAVGFYPDGPSAYNRAT